ncbi:Pyridine nucleotide-disulphide oxidoreductase [Humidesulfovibrio mexicanus]|uniref:Pyridine nucleotide-disulphide oxidoreductase n=1 Tax=Humidesulfovibrio mexicanus TaxID=147047 RepID=A0A239D1G4_9BACT|nr:FAD-dependent oxidoreductase [Humidesulfovibrio mexicanus]SNS25453.1 Pyridine nucleotide-disulphide oxidoreductase [Humidesulfovibrio mexicanus]
MTYVLIGNGVSSIGAIEGIRRYDKDGRIIVIGAEDAPAYGRPLISYLLAGKIGPDRLALRGADYYEKNGVELKLGTTVTAVDTAKKIVNTDTGETVKYDRLLIATGGIPFVPPIPGVKGEDIYSFTTLAHAQTLIELSAKIKRAVVIGGGLIGLKAAESLHDRGVSVTILELAPRILSGGFDEKAGALAANRLKKVGIEVNCGVTAKEIQRTAEGRVKGVLLTDGRFLECDVVVVAIGVVPHSQLAKDAGLKVERGIMVDDRLMTSAKDVYAAGDVAQAKDQLTGEHRVVPIWPNAYNQGYACGRNMAGAKLPYQGGLPMNSISFYGLPTISVGVVNPPEDDASFEVHALLDEAKEAYRKLVFRDGRLVGYVLVGDIDKGGMYTAFIKFEMPLDGEAKDTIINAGPDVFLWPAELFDQTWNPEPTQAAR